MNYKVCIQRTIDYVEEHIRDPITVDELARQAGFSQYHYFRLFKAYVGISVMEYVRRRKLCYGAAELCSGRRLLDIALEFGFDSHEGFSRAFKKVYGTTPNEFRIHATGNLPCKVNLALLDDYNLMGGIVLEPKFINKAAFKIAGYELKTTSQDGENSTAVPKFWTRYLEEGWGAKLRQLNIVSNGEMGICFPADMESGYFSYVIGMEVRDFEGVTGDLFTAEIKGATYAVFTTPPADDAGFVQSIQGTWRYIYENWFPNSGYEYDGGGKADFELYDERCMGDTGKQIDIYIPVVKRG